MFNRKKKGKKSKPKQTVLESLEDELFDKPEDDPEMTEPDTELEPEQIIKSTLDIAMSKDDAEFLKKIGFKPDWLAALANQFDFTSFKYIHKFKAFRCYRDKKHCDWIDVNELSIYQIRKDITSILQRYQPLLKSKKIITWR